MQERLGALAICMGSAMQPCQVPTQLVVQALYVMRMRLAYGVLRAINDGSIRPMVVRAILDVIARR